MGVRVPPPAPLPRQKVCIPQTFCFLPCKHFFKIQGTKKHSITLHYNNFQTVNISIENLGLQHNIVRFTIANEDYRDRFEKSLKTLAKKAQIPGFRPGHVPSGMVKKMYGDSAMLDELYKIVNEQMNAYLKDNNYELLGDALPVEAELGLNISEAKTYQFAYEIGVQPAIDLTINLNKNKTLTRYQIDAKPEEVEQEFQRILIKYGERKDVDTIEENDVVYAHALELNDDGSPKADGINAETYFNLQMLHADFQSMFLGAKQDDVKNIDDVFSVFIGDKVKIAKNILHLTEATEESVESVSSKFEFKIDKIARMFPAELDDNFYEAISKEFGAIATETELREKIGAGISQYINIATEVTLENELFKYLIDTTEVPLPDVFLRKWFSKSNEKDIAATDFEAEFADFLTKLKQSLIYREVQKSHELSVTNEEIIQEAVNTVRASYGQMGDELVQYITQTQLKDTKFVETMHDRVAQKRFFDVIKGFITINPQPITLEAFQQLTKKEEEAYAE